MRTKRTVTFQVTLPRTPARWLLVGAAVVIGAVGAVAVAAPQAFVANEPLSAAKLNANFGDLDARLRRFESTSCGKSAITTAKLDNVNGFAAGATLCRSVMGCNANAHVCTQEEMFRLASGGMTVPEQGWIAGTVGMYGSFQCNGLTTEDSNAQGTTWGPGAKVGTSSCGTKLPVFCCN